MNKFSALPLIILLSANVHAAPPQALLLTGVVTPMDAQLISVPRSDSWRSQLMWAVTEGSEVKAGEAVMRFDVAASGSQLEALELQALQAQQQALKAVTDLRVQTADAEKAHSEAQSRLDKAKVDAAIPKAFLSALQYDRYHLELSKASGDHQQALTKFTEQAALLDERLKADELAKQKLAIDIAAQQRSIERAEILAERDGTIVYEVDRRTGRRVEVGDTLQSSDVVAKISSSNKFLVDAWLNEVDRLQLKVGAKVKLTLDAYPHIQMDAKVLSISHQAERKREWGEGAYFEVQIAPEQIAKGLTITLGMSVLVEIEMPVDLESAP